MRSAVLLAGLIMIATAASVRADSPGATSNDVERIARQMEQADQALREQVKALEAKVAQLTEALGDRRGAEKFDSVSEDMRDLKRRMDRLERDLDRLQQMVGRLESKR